MSFAQFFESHRFFVNQMHRYHVALEYLERLCESYTEFFFYYSETPLLVLDVNDVDFVANNDDYQKVVDCLQREIKGREFINLTPSFF